MSSFSSSKDLCLQVMIKWPMMQWPSQPGWPIVWTCTLSSRQGSLSSWFRFSLRFRNSLSFHANSMRFTFYIFSCIQAWDCLLQNTLRCDPCSITLPPCSCRHHTLKPYQQLTALLHASLHLITTLHFTEKELRARGHTCSQWPT